MNIILTATSPIVHGEFKDGVDTGNIMNFRRISIASQGKIYSIPAISGNSTRGALRRILTGEIIEKYRLKDSLGSNFDKFYIAIATGGNLNKNMDVSIDTERIRTLRKSFPLVSVLGSALYRYMIPGMVSIGFAIPRCLELQNGYVRLSDLTEDVGLTRHIDKTKADPGEAKPMPYTVETVIPGVEFDLEIQFAPQATDVEKACINHGLKQLSAIGGKSAVGFGRVSVSGFGDDTAYINWLEDPETEKKLVEFAGEL